MINAKITPHEQCLLYVGLFVLVIQYLFGGCCAEPQNVGSQCIIWQLCEIIHNSLLLLLMSLIITPHLTESSMQRTFKSLLTMYMCHKLIMCHILLLCHSLEWVELYIVENNILFELCMIRAFNLRLLQFSL